MNNKQKLLTATAITGTIVSASAFTVFDYAICRRKKQPDVRKKEKWKPYLREGVTQWNELFEQIGFKDVVAAKDFPTDDPEFEPDNIKYSCVRYAPSSIENAMGP